MSTGVGISEADTRVGTDRNSAERDDGLAKALSTGSAAGGATWYPGSGRRGTCRLVTCVTGEVAPPGRTYATIGAEGGDRGYTSGD